MPSLSNQSHFLSFGPRTTSRWIENTLFCVLGVFCGGNCHKGGNGRITAASGKRHPDAPNDTFWAHDIRRVVTSSACVCLGALGGALWTTGHQFGCQNGPSTVDLLWWYNHVVCGAFMCQNGTPRRPNCTDRHMKLFRRSDAINF